MKKIGTNLLVVLLTILFTCFVVNFCSAATPEEIEDSIALGVPWLASQQDPNGSWGSNNITAKTGLAVLKLIDYVKEVPDIDSWTDPNYIYHYEVVDGLNYLFKNGYYVDISVQTYGDPDTLDNDKGIRFNGFDDYETSIALMALGATMTPTRTVTVAPLSGVTYADVVQDIVDYLSYTQRESTWARGGWGYEWDPNWADNSVSGYASLGLGYAQSFGATIPQFVKDELTHWIGIIQSPAGYSYYRPPDVWLDPYGDLLLRTGNLLYEMALVGMPVDDSNVQSALTYIENNWALGGNSYQRAYCLMKGLEAYGITDEISVGGSGDWFDELSTYIVSTQNIPPGNWPHDPHDWDSPYVMTAAWALLTLERAVAIPTNEPPDCSDAQADIDCLWPPNHRFVDVGIVGVTDPDGDPITITITGITSDEPTATAKGAGGAKHAPDASGVGTDTASVRAERSGSGLGKGRGPGNGRVYEISFTADDGRGGECEGTVQVVVPHDHRRPEVDPPPNGPDHLCDAVDDGQDYDATQIN